MIMDMYPTFMGTTKDAIWTKVDVRQARQDEQMSFTVQTKAADDRSSKWRTAGKVVIIASSTGAGSPGTTRESSSSTASKVSKNVSNNPVKTSLIIQ
jgi:hypothetical protein